MENNTFIEQVDSTVCSMNYERGTFKEKYIIESIERIPNDEGVPSLYVTLKTNSPQMYYIVAEITDFTVLADPMPQDDKNELLKVIFDRQTFAKEFNAAFKQAKTIELNNAYWSAVEEIPQDEYYEGKMDVLSDDYQKSLEGIIQFEEPTSATVSEK